MPLLLSTPGTGLQGAVSIVINDLGERTFTTGTVDYNISDEYTDMQLMMSDSLQTLLDDSDVTLKNDHGHVITNINRISESHPCYLNIEDVPDQMLLVGDSTGHLESKMKSELGISANIYIVKTEAEINQALIDIGTGFGRIIIDSSFSTSAQITINGGGSYIIEGRGDKTVITPDGNHAVFWLTLAESCIFKNFKIDGTLTTSACIYIYDTNDKSILIDNVTISGGDTNSKGIYIRSSNVIVNRCTFENIYNCIYIYSTTARGIIINGNRISSNNYGIYITAVSSIGKINIISNNVFNGGFYGIRIETSILNHIIGNSYYNTTYCGIMLNGACNNNSIIGNNICYNSGSGIKIVTNSNDNIISNNLIENNSINDGNGYGGIEVTSSDDNHISGNCVQNNINSGAGVYIGINILNALSNNNGVVSNKSRNNDTQYNDLGTGTYASGNHF